MAQKKKDSIPTIHTPKSISPPLYVELMSGEANEALDAFEGFMRAKGTTDLSNLDTNVHGRTGLTMQGYGRFRPSEAVPDQTDIRKILIKSDVIYHRTAIIRNIVDLMADFACQGIRLSHKSKKTQEFYRKWWKRIDGSERSERFCNLLVRLANVVVKRQTAKIPVRVKRSMMRATGSPDTKIETLKVHKREIPWRYVFLHPASVDVVGGPLAAFTGNKRYEISLTTVLKRIILTPRTAAERALVADLPDDIKLAATTSKAIPLDPEKTVVFHYKKDDWNSWAFPLTYSAMDAISLYEKLRLADKAALDGAISNIRIFKLGSLEYKIAPSRAAAQKLANILKNNTNAGSFDLIWGPDIELIESSTTVHQFLGEEKYRPALSDIYAAFGIPATLTGSQSSSGTTNNFISLKTLIARLESLRKVLVRFWEEEIRIVQEAMGFASPAIIEFENMSLGDEASQNAMMLQLLDRDLISEEMLQIYLKNNPDMEFSRIQKEQQARKVGKREPKAGPFYDPRFIVALQKIALSKMTINPEDVGISSTVKQEDRGGMGPAGSRDKPSSVKKGESQKGRPQDSKDSGARKTKTFVPKTKASVNGRVETEFWADVAQMEIAEVVNPLLLDHFGARNMRSLSSIQREQAERIKFGVLYHLEPFGDVSESSIKTALAGGGAPIEAIVMCEEWSNTLAASLNKTLLIEEVRKIQSCIYTELTT